MTAGKTICVRVTEIVWDTDDQEVNLPTEVVLEIDENDWYHSGNDELVVESLSDKYGFCVISCLTEEV